MGEIVNLRRFKKTRRRAEAASEADAQRLLHGRTAAERDAGRAERARADRALDAAALKEPKRP